MLTRQIAKPRAEAGAATPQRLPPRTWPEMVAPRRNRTAQGS
jgi:hypothetical protein